MNAPRPGHRLWTGWLLAFSLAAAPGCLNFCHSVATPPPEQLESCRQVSGICRKCVHIFLLNGTDALGCANLAGLQQYLFDLGFPNTYYGEACHNAWFRDEIRRIAREEPDAHFVLVGYDIGAKAACNVAKWVTDNGVIFDLIVYIDPLMLDNDGSCRPGNATEVLNVVSSSGTSLDCIEEVRVPEAGHFSVPTHSSTLCLLANQLIKIAGEVVPLPPPERVPVLEMPPVPVPGAPPPMPPADETAPTPRPVPPAQTSQGGDWDFLKPADRLQAVPPAPTATPAPQGGDWHDATVPYPLQWGRLR